MATTATISKLNGSKLLRCSFSITKLGYIVSVFKVNAGVLVYQHNGPGSKSQYCCDCISPDQSWIYKAGVHSLVSLLLPTHERKLHAHWSFAFVHCNQIQVGEFICHHRCFSIYSRQQH